jgi:hypothetical protein
MGWVWVQNNRDAREVISRCTAVITEISMDHDLGAIPHGEAGIMARGWDEDNGLKLVEWMVAKNYVPPVITIHSWNPEGAKRMQQTFADAGYEAIVRPFDPYEHGFTY